MPQRFGWGCVGRLGPNWVKIGSYRVKRGSIMGHVGRPGHMLWVKWVTWAVWATGLVKLSLSTFGATGILGQAFWATGLLNG